MKKYLIWSIMLICYSCEYEHKDVYFVDIDQNVNSPVSQIDLNFATDTVYLSSPSTIEFTIQAPGHKFNWIRFYINDVNYGAYFSNSGTFEISPSYFNYKNGVYLIRIEAFSNSGTGSIADAIGAEGFLFEYTWVMVINDEMFLASQFKKISRDNRKLRLEWDVYKGTNFVYYEILKSTDRNEWYSVCKIYDQLTLNTFDPSYIGEKAIYRINTQANGTLYGREADYQDTIPQLRLENFGDKSFKLSWKSYFTDNIAGYAISIAKNNEYGYDLVATLPASDSTYIFQNGKFGTESELMLTTIPKNAPSYFSDDFNRNWYYSSKCEGIIGKKSFNLGGVYVPYGNRLIYRTNNTIIFYDYDSRIKTDSVVSNSNFHIRSVSPDGNYIMGYENNTNFFIYDVSGGTWKTIPFAQITGIMNYYYNMAISNTGVAILNADDDYYVYDFLNSNVLASKTDFGYIPLDLKISADGKYFYNGYNFYFQIEGDSITQLPDINLWFYDFNPLNPEEVIVYTPNSSIQFINIDTRNISRSIPISSDVIHNIDFNAGRILGSSENEFKVYDLNNGDLIWSYPTYSQTNFSSSEFHLCKDVIYWYEGYSINIE